MTRKERLAGSTAGTKRATISRERGEEEKKQQCGKEGGDMLYNDSRLGMRDGV